MTGHSALIDSLVAAAGILAAIATIVGALTPAGSTVVIIGAVVTLAAAIVKLVKAAGSEDTSPRSETQQALRIVTSLSQYAQQRYTLNEATQGIFQELQIQTSKVVRGITARALPVTSAEAAACTLAHSALDEQLIATRDHLRPGRNRDIVNSAIEMRYRR